MNFKRLRTVICAVLCLAMLLTSIPMASAANNRYSNWFQADYNEMQQLGLIPDSFNGYDLTMDITRGEMCRLAVFAFEKITKDSIEPQRTDYFSDTSDPMILKAYENGIVGGYPDGTYRPNQKLTRQEFFKIIENFCNAAAFRPSAFGTDLSGFYDAGKIADWAIDAAKICYRCGYVYGSTTNQGESLNPTGFTSRQEAMTMFLRCYKGLNEYYYGLVHSATVVDDSSSNVTVRDYRDTLYVSASVLNVRSSWSSDSMQVGTLRYGAEVEVTGKCSNGWIQIDFNGDVAYVSGSYLSGSSSDNDEDAIVVGNGSGAEIANYVMQFVGYSYVYGGASPSAGFDCSGLMYYCLSQFGYSMNRVADDQMDQGYAVDYDDLQVGDLVFFGYGSYSDHVGMYIGGGNFVHASTPSSGVRVDSLQQTYYANKYIGARRIIG